MKQGTFWIVMAAAIGYYAAAVAVQMVVDTRATAEASERVVCYQIRQTVTRYGAESYTCKGFFYLASNTIGISDCQVTDGFMTWHVDKVLNPSNVIEVECPYEKNR